MSPTLTGLALNFIGVILLLFYPPITRNYTKEGAPEAAWVGNPTRSGRWRWLARRVLSRAGLMLLAVGLSVQIYAELQAARRGSNSSQYLACTFMDDKRATHERAFMLALDGTAVKDAWGDRWEVRVNTPVRITAAHEDMLNGKDVGGFMLELNRLNGSATFSRLAAASKKPDGDLPAGFQTVESEETGRCSLQKQRAIE